MHLIDPGPACMPATALRHMQFIRTSCHIRRVFALLWSEFRLLAEEDTDICVVFVCVFVYCRETNSKSGRDSKEK